MARKNTVTVDDVFKVMAKHDFNVKEASQELQINKSRIYNIKHRHKDEWQALLDEHKKEANEMERKTALIKVANNKVKPIRSVKSELEEKHVGVTRRISDDKLPEVPKKSNLKPLYEENAKLAKQNEEIKLANDEIAGALKRSNDEKQDIGKDYNNLVDEYHALKAQLKEVKQTAVQPLEVEETVYAVKLGKMFVTPDLRLYSHHSAAQFTEIENAKKIKDDVGGTLYKSVLMPVEAE